MLDRRGYFRCLMSFVAAAPDGYTVLIATNTTHAANEHLFKKIPYDSVNDFAPVTALARGGQVMVVHPRVPAKTQPAVIARLRELFIGATRHASAQKFFKTTGIEPWTTTSAELAKFQASKSAKWARVIKAAGIQLE